MRRNRRLLWMMLGAAGYVRPKLRRWGSRWTVRRGIMVMTWKLRNMVQKERKFCEKWCRTDGGMAGAERQKMLVFMLYRKQEDFTPLCTCTWPVVYLPFLRKPPPMLARNQLGLARRSFPLQSRFRLLLLIHLLHPVSSPPPFGTPSVSRTPP